MSVNTTPKVYKMHVIFYVVELDKVKALKIIEDFVKFIENHDAPYLEEFYKVFRIFVNPIPEEASCSEFTGTPGFSDAIQYLIEENER